MVFITSSVCVFVVLFFIINRFRTFRQLNFLGGIGFSLQHKRWNTFVDVLNAFVWMCFGVVFLHAIHSHLTLNIHFSLRWYLVYLAVWAIGSVCCLSAYALIVADSKRDLKMVRSILTTTMVSLLYTSSGLGILWLGVMPVPVSIYYTIFLAFVGLLANAVLIYRLKPIINKVFEAYRVFKT